MTLATTRSGLSQLDRSYECYTLKAWSRSRQNGVRNEQSKLSALADNRNYKWYNSEQGKSYTVSLKVRYSAIYKKTSKESWIISKNLGIIIQCGYLRINSCQAMTAESS
jgi:hypothetical protein